MPNKYIPKDEAARKAQAVGRAHTAKEYRVHDAITRKGIPSEQAWRITNSLPPESRGRRPNR